MKVHIHVPSEYPKNCIVCNASIQTTDPASESEKDSEDGSEEECTIAGPGKGHIPRHLKLMSRHRHKYVSKFRELSEPEEDSKSEDGFNSKKRTSFDSTNQGELTVYSLLLSHSQVCGCCACVHVSVQQCVQHLVCRPTAFVMQGPCVFEHTFVHSCLHCILHNTIYIDYTFTYMYLILYVCMYVHTHVHMYSHTLPYMQFLSLSLSWGTTPLSLRPQANPLGQEWV